ncbi:MAG TPA: gliding motility-associated C-terminal domain-containing protein [Flavobacteriales bacterium]|nr:gliding motility-associated C-terminal domain-containing protein [Flavobacteriales bacterium]
MNVYFNVRVPSLENLGRAAALFLKCASVLFVNGSCTVQAAMDPPILRCASVDVNGDVTLTWTVPPDPGGEFGNYRIYSSTDINGPFAPITSIAVYGTTSFLSVGANANIGAQYYYLTTITAGPSPEESAPSDTVATIYLQLFQSTPPGSADLFWTATPSAPTAADSISIWMEYPIGTWQIIAEVPSTTLSYQHTITVCDDSLSFRVERADVSGCISSSNFTGDRFEDVTPPSSPVITVVTVDTLSGLATVDWEPSPEADTDGYIIVFNAPGGAAIIDTVFGQFNTEYEWSESLAGLRPESYTIAAFDTCETGIPPSPNTSATLPFHTSMYLGHSYDQCAGEVSLEWSAYVGWPVESQQLFVQVDGGQWTLLVNLPGDATTHVHEVEPFRTYCYAVEASRGMGLAASLSNSTCVDTDYPGLPAFNYIRTVTVSGSEQITVVDSLDLTAQVTGYRLERSENGGDFVPMATQGPSLTSVIEFVDNDVDPAAIGYQYRVIVKDACGADALTSNIGANIVLSAVADLRGYNTLAWNGYLDWAGDVNGYGLYRQVEDAPFTLLNTVPADPWLYPDDVSGLTSTTGRFCYYVLAFEEGNPSGINATSRSNEVCAVQEELVYIPNAFVIGGYNPVFRPVLSYVDVSEYELSIINRWGQVFWTTDDPTVAWDGTVDGEPVPLGIYAYYCNFKNGAGRVFEKRGTVTMLTAMD